MKKVKFIIPALILIALGIFLLAGDSAQTIRPGKVQSTDLQDVIIEGMRPGNKLVGSDLPGYSHNDSGGIDYYYETMIVTEDNDGYITKILGYSNSDYSVNGVSDFATPDDVIAVLGNNYHEYWFDREQRLMAITYTDANNAVYLTCVFDKSNRDFVWLILSN